jgi:hypothetical protein
VSWAIFVHDPDGDMGYGEVVGPFASAECADRKAQYIRNAAVYRGREVECIVVPISRAGASAPGELVMRVSP